MKFDLPPPAQKSLEDFFIALVEYQLAGRLMIWQGLCGHLEMIGAINIVQSLVGYKRGTELIEQALKRPEVEGWKTRDGAPKGWPFKDLNAAYAEFKKPDHHCFYCDLVPKPKIAVDSPALRE